MGFATSFATTKIRSLRDGTIKLMAKWDPESVGAAQLEEWDVQARELAATAAKAQTDARVAAEAAANIKANFERYRAAAKKLEEAQNVAAAEKAANQALEWHGKLAGAEDEAKDATEWAAEVLEAAQRAQQLVIDGREKIAAAQRDQARATHEANISEQRRKDRERMAGITTGGLSGATAALDAMTANAAELREKAAANKIRSDVLGKATEADADVVAALQEVDGTNKPKTLADKMAALKNL